MNVGYNIKKLREANNITQSQIGDFLGIDQSMVAKIESSERNITTVQLDKLCDLFGCEQRSLLEEVGQSNRLHFAFRSKSASIESLKVIAAVNKIANNLRIINRLLENDDAQ